MSSPNFRFKHFTVWHDRCAMKVGTDGVLLGAWCPMPNPQYPIALQGVQYPISNIRLLDIGTGSGLISLMLAQRLSSLSPIANNQSPIAHIDAIDIDADAVAQAADNFAQSPWQQILHVHHSTLQDWQTTSKGQDAANMVYDVIVSNPPYFQDSLKNPDNQRATARHTDTLSYADLITHAARLLKDNGILALILPIEAESTILSIANSHNLYPTRITYIHSKPNKPAKRILITFERNSSREPQTNTFYIESECAPRSQEYQELTRDFYL